MHYGTSTGSVQLPFKTIKTYYHMCKCIPDSTLDMYGKDYN